MTKRSGHAVNEGLEGRRERPATGMGSPSRRGAAGVSPSLTRLGFLAEDLIKSPERQRGDHGLRP